MERGRETQAHAHNAGWVMQHPRMLHPTHLSNKCAPCNDAIMLDASCAGVVAQYHGIEGVIAMNGGTPPHDAFPFATLGGDLAPDPSPSPAAATAAAAASEQAGPHSAASSQPSSAPLERLHITDPTLVALAQQYCFAPKVCGALHSWVHDELHGWAA